MRISDWSSDVCSSDLAAAALRFLVKRRGLGRVGGLGLAERQEQQAEEGDQSKHGGVPFVVRFEVRGARISTPPRRGGSGPGGWRTRSTRGRPSCRRRRIPARRSGPDVEGDEREAVVQRHMRRTRACVYQLDTKGNNTTIPTVETT